MRKTQWLPSDQSLRAPIKRNFKMSAARPWKQKAQQQSTTQQRASNKRKEKENAANTA
jgi:hypothetical protein